MSNCYCHPGRAGGTPVVLEMLYWELGSALGMDRMLNDAHRHVFDFVLL